MFFHEFIFSAFQLHELMHLMKDSYKILISFQNNYQLNLMKVYEILIDYHNRSISIGTSNFFKIMKIRPIDNSTAVHESKIETLENTIFQLNEKHDEELAKKDEIESAASTNKGKL